jgi:hypothetical protein
MGKKRRQEGGRPQGVQEGYYQLFSIIIYIELGQTQLRR